MNGIRVNTKIGIGDKIQFTSVPENYFRHTGENLVDLDESWIFDLNPYVVRGDYKCDKVFDLWEMHCYNTAPVFKERTVLLSNAESHARNLDYPVVMNRPRLYCYENFPVLAREKIILHTKGKSHGPLPSHVVEHILQKYGRSNIIRVGRKEEWMYSLAAPAFHETSSMWELAKFISDAKLFIGVDSGPSWIAQCYPDVITKKVRLIPDHDRLKEWVPLQCCILNSHWDDRSAQIYNSSEDDLGFTWSYKRI